MWDRNAEPTVAGYIVAYGTQSGNYPNRIDVGNVTSWQLNLAIGQRYYLVVQAYDTSAQFSPRSAEVWVDMVGPSITNLSPTSGPAGTSVTISGANFGSTQGGSTVRFNGTAATPTSWSDTRIVVPVPSGATSGPVVVTVNGVASSGVTFLVPTTGGLPAPWASQDIGNPAIAGQATYSSGVFSVSGAGVDIWDVNDQFRFVYQTLDGDGEIIARVDSLQNTDAWTKAGVMIREDLAANAPDAVAEVTAGNGMVFQSRATRGGLTTSIKGFAGAAPRWIRLVRSGTTFSGYYSADGTTWTLMATRTVTMASRVYAGLAVTSHNASAIAAGAFSNVNVIAAGGSPPPNQAPTLTRPANQTSAEGATASLQLVASDPDGNPLTYSATGLPASLSVNATTGLISGTLTSTSAGSYSVTATASDGALSSSQTFTWTVTDVSQALPGPWTSQDVGNPAIAGQATYSSASSTFSIVAAGVDIWDVNDQFRFVYQTLDGDGEIIARVASVQNTDPWTKAGVMIREDLTGNAPNAVAQVTPGNGMTFQRRDTRGALSTSIKGFAGTAPQWIRVVRSGSSLSGYYSANGTGWTLMGTFTVTMPTRVYIGLSVTSHNASATATATFTDVSVTAASTTGQATAPSSLSSAMIGSATQTTGQSEPSAAANAAKVSKPVNGLTSGDYDGDRQSDIAIYRPSNGTWEILKSGDNFATGSTARWGTRTDRPVPGDYDGDGKADLAYYRPSTGTWSILKSSTNNTTHVDILLGGGDDVPVPSDYDGDGITDVAVYSSVTGQWWILKSSTGSLMQIAWGAATDVPVPADYDGDGKTDLAVYRPSTGQWQILQSGTDYATNRTLVLGAGADIPVPADYDGDGDSDVAVFQPSTGMWQVRLSSTGFKTSTLATLGASTDVPVAGDYEGDGRADLAVFHDGTWQILYSRTNYASGGSISLGRRADVPLPKRP